MPLGMLGKYERLDVLGHGASGIVYLAKDTLLGRQVALKEMAAQGEDKERILGEARVLDRLRHPNIVQVIGVDEIGGKVIIAMEYVRGPSLQDILRHTPQLPVAQAIGLAAQICDGLAFAHAHRTVHRDVKPANILVDRDGVVKLVDFGLAEVLGTHSMAGGAGTYAYMAPEDFHEEEQSDRQSDIWAAGVILYEMLAGHRPFSVGKNKDPFSWKRAVEQDIPTPISALRADVSLAVDFLVARALAKDKRHRYADAGEMAHDLRALGIPALSAFGTVPPSGAEKGQWQESFAASHNAEELHSEAFETATAAMNGSPPSSPVNGPLPQPGSGLTGFPSLATIDEFLTTAPDQWEAARTALVGGAVSNWLTEIGEVPMAVVAQEIAAEPGREDDDRLRDFLYRAGLEIIPEARRCFAEGERRFKEGRFAEAVSLLRRAIHLDPTQAQYHQRLAEALRAAGDSVAAASALDEGLAFHPTQRVLTKARQELTGAEVTLSTDRVDFGVMRQGQSRTARLTVRNSGGGVLEGRVASAPAWVRIEPAAWTTRQRQPLTLTARTDGIRQAPAAYQETVVLETSGGRREIAVLASVLPARRGIGQVLHWYFPLLFCCLLPAIAGSMMPTLIHYAPNHFPNHNGLGGLWQAGTAASGLLCAALFVVTFAADTVWALRLLPLFFIGLFVIGFADSTLPSYSAQQLARAAMLQTSAPVLTLLILQAVAVAADPHGWGRWQIWRWIVAAVSLLVTFALLHIG
jgi:serine/threonine protein kinase